MSLSDFAAIFGIVSTLIGGVYFLIHQYSLKQQEIERLKSSNTKSALNRFDEQIKEFRFSISGIQTTIKELSASLVQNRSDVAVLKERLDETKKLLERFEQTQNESVRNMIKSEITNLTNKIMLIRQGKT